VAEQEVFQFSFDVDKRAKDFLVSQLGELELLANLA
jgi:hypothetical protein